MKALLVILLSVTAWAVPVKRQAFDFSAVSQMAIQDRGRLKPFQTFAMESLQYVTGKRQWNGMSPVECMFSWLVVYDKEWQDEKFIKITYNALKEAMGLPVDRSYFSPGEIEANSGLQGLVREALAKQNRKERQSELEKKALQVQNQSGLINLIISGRAWEILPNPEGKEQDWPNLANLGERGQALPYSQENIREIAERLRPMVASYSENNAANWNQSSTEFVRFLKADLSKGHYPSLSEMDREIFYNNLRPFRWAWILYVGAFLTLLLKRTAPGSVGGFLGPLCLAAGFGFHVLGFALRILIAGRPPVTNMYESVIWVSWGCVLFSLVIWTAYKNNIIPMAASVFAIVALVLADNLPSVLDPSINPLEPVLRSNFWLTIHVLTITLSYAAFALSLCLGNVVLGNYFFRPKQTSTIQTYTLYMYRAVQIGVILLAAGTILGGVWADYSWGRFWGWDPKEVWALIALLLYLAVLHGRFTGWLQGFGFVATTVICFLGVLMAWYGVNFVLGVGLHSYGFGSGGLTYVAAYVALQLGFILAAYFKKRGAGGASTAIFPGK